MPGLSTALVTRNAIGRGPIAAWRTTMGINLANLTYAFASALGLSVVLARWPGTFTAIRSAGAVYLAILGLTTIRRALANREAASGVAGGAPSPRATGLPDFAEGLVTNLLNPPVVLFYATYVPQFVRPDEPYFRTYMGLALVHIGISLTWLTAYGVSIGRLGAALGRPRVRHGIELATGGVFIALALRVALGS